MGHIKDYLKADYWDLREAVILLFGGTPIDDDGIISAADMPPLEGKDADSPIEEAYEIALRSLNTGELRFIGRRELTWVAPADFRDWAIAKGYDIPEAWKQASLVEFRTLPLEAYNWLMDEDEEIQIERQDESARAKVVSGADSCEANQRTLEKAEHKTREEEQRARDLTELEHLQVFREMDRLMPTEVTIRFVYGNRVDICARGKSKRVSYESFDLLDRAKGVINTQGAALLGMMRSTKLPKNQANRKVVSRLRGIFKKRLGISDDPFQKDWEPHFLVEDLRKTPDDRAREEAHHVAFDEQYHRSAEYPIEPVNDEDPAAKYLK